ncbi:MAG TPA: FAD-dependent oxidoreductase [Vicinamibacterales bacterium]|nr:FAD-dependent oxidoreductase [Vicinamibacterales bacterium]
MTDPVTHPIVILGGGPAGLAAAYQLARRGWRDVTVLERGARVGGNAGSFVHDGIPVDFGSHRLHPSTSPALMADITALLGADLLDRPRHGRIRLQGRWVHFPLKPVDLALRLPPAFALGVVGDALTKRFAPEVEPPTFASLLEKGLGKTICREFYFPYAQKLWGLPPEALDAEQARRRVANSSLGKMIRRVLNAVPGLKPPGAGRFFYPKRGFGQIADAFAAAAVAAGARVALNAQVEAVTADGTRVTGVAVTLGGERQHLPARQVLSTIPLTVLARLVTGTETPPPLAAASGLGYRGMVLIYVTLEAEQFTEFDAHYFPESHLRISRMSEPKNYSLTASPGRTVLCAELPCAVNGEEWSMSDPQLLELFRGDIMRAGLGPLPPVARVHVERIPQAYPLYTEGYRQAFDALDQWAGTIEGLVTFGRQGLFVHDNTHHTMAMAYALADCLQPSGALDRHQWADARRGFESNVVED